VDISTIVKLTSNNSREDETIQGLSGRKLKVKRKVLIKNQNQNSF
jgi:hypothetical protein